jgi:hypothetical protein
MERTGKNLPAGRQFSVRQLLFYVALCAIILGLPRVLRKYDRVGWKSTAFYVSELDSPHTNTVLNGLYFLKIRKDPIAIPRAIELLSSADDYIWLNAASYLGACEHQAAIPYLIKALRHTAWRADEKTVSYLQHLTKQKIGADFKRGGNGGNNSLNMIRISTGIHIWVSHRVSAGKQFEHAREPSCKSRRSGAICCSKLFQHIAPIWPKKLVDRRREMCYRHSTL